MFTRWLLPAAALVVAGFALFIANQSGRQVSELAEENQTLHEVIDRLPVADVRKFELGGTEASPGAHAWAYVDFNDPEDPTDDQWAVHVDRLPAAPKGKVYQAWIETDGGAHDLGAFRPDASGYGYTNKTVPGVAGEFIVHVTLEEDAGAPIPSGPVFLKNSRMSFTQRPPTGLVLPPKTDNPSQDPDQDD